MNPQVNYMTKRIHLTIADMLRTIVFEGENWFNEFDTILQTVAWAVISKISTATSHSPGQLVFNPGMIIQTAITVNWEIIKQRKRYLTVIANNRDNKNRIKHTYAVGDLILIILNK